MLYVTVRKASCLIQTHYGHQKEGKFYKLPKWQKRNLQIIYLFSLSLNFHSCITPSAPAVLLFRSLSSLIEMGVVGMSAKCHVFIGVALSMILISVIAMTMWTEIIVWLFGCLFYCSSS